MTGKNFSKLCKDCKILGWKKLTQTDIDMEFAKKIKKGSKMSFNEFKLVMNGLAVKKKEENADVLFAMVIGKDPVTAGTKISQTGNVSKMTDASQYTGSHKEIKITWQIFSSYVFQIIFMKRFSIDDIFSF